MTKTRRLGCTADGSFRRAKSYFSEVRTLANDPGYRGARDLIEGLAALGAPCTVIAAYFDPTAETIMQWHNANASLPVIVWDALLDLGSIMIREAEIREARREALNSCTRSDCRRRRAGKREIMLQDIFAELVGVGANYAEP